MNEAATKLIIFMIFDPQPTPVLREVLGRLDLSEHDPVHKAETMRYMTDTRTEAYTEDLLKLHAGLVRSVLIDIIAMRNESKEGLN